MQGQKFGGGVPGRKIGTGGDGEKSYSGPGFGRTLVNGFLLGLGWMAALGVVNVIKNRSKSDSDAPGALEDID